MTTVVFRTDPPGITARGHSDYAPRGRDIVCAAVSAVLSALPETLTRLGISSRVKTGDGYMLVEALPDNTNREDADTVFLFVLTAVELIEKSFPRCVRIERAATRERDCEIIRAYMEECV